MRPPAECRSMAEVRAAIDALDRALVTLLAERAAYIGRAGELKAENGWPARIPERVEEVVSNARAHADQAGLDPDMVERMWRMLVNWSIDREEAALSPDHRREPE